MNSLLNHYFSLKPLSFAAVTFGAFVALVFVMAFLAAIIACICINPGQALVAFGSMIVAIASFGGLFALISFLVEYQQSKP